MALGQPLKMLVVIVDGVVKKVAPDTQVKAIGAGAQRFLRIVFVDGELKFEEFQARNVAAAQKKITGGILGSPAGMLDKSVVFRLQKVT